MAATRFVLLALLLGTFFLLLPLALWTDWLEGMMDDFRESCVCPFGQGPWYRDRPSKLHHPGVQPPLREGHVWRWHPQYGRWVSFASAGAPVEMVLPVTYALPAKVEVYEVEAEGGSCLCPYCGHVLQIR
jgi:hypothetical protein